MATFRSDSAEVDYEAQLERFASGMPVTGGRPVPTAKLTKIKPDRPVRTPVQLHCDTRRIEKCGSRDTVYEIHREHRVPAHPRALATLSTSREAYDKTLRKDPIRDVKAYAKYMRRKERRNTV